MELRTAGDKIRQLRTEKAWTQEELAAVAGISPRTVQRSEEGQMSAETLDWVADAFGLEIRVRIPDAEGRVVHGELFLDDARIIVGQPVASRNWTTPDLAGVNTQSVYALIDDVDEHYERAKSHGATILMTPENMHGDRRYLAADPEGHHWWFVTPIGPCS